MADLALGVVEFSAGYQLVDDLVTAVAGDGAISRDSYGLLRLGIQAKATNWLTLFVEGNNLLDEKYAIDAGYPLPGANVLGGLRVRY
jgi:iron complex outermembrane receptor protein